MSLKITYNKKDMTDIEKCEFNVKVGNMNIPGGETVNLREVLYVPQYVNKLLIISRLASKGSTMGNKYKKSP